MLLLYNYKHGTRYYKLHLKCVLAFKPCIRCEEILDLFPDTNRSNGRRNTVFTDQCRWMVVSNVTTLF